MKRNAVSLACCIFVAAVFVTDSNAQFSATYDFASVTTSSGTTDPTAVPTVSGLTFGTFSAVGVSTNPNAGGVFSFTSWSTGATTGSDSFSGSIDTSRYYQFTLTPNSGQQFTLTSFTFDAGRSSTGPRQFVVRSSLDGYTSNLTASATNANVAIVDSNVFQFTDNGSTQTYSGNSITLTNGTFSNMTTAVSFRIYAYNSEGNTGSFRIDNFGVNGSLSAIPEPSTYAAIFGSVALAGAVWHRRRRSRIPDAT